MQRIYCDLTNCKHLGEDGVCCAPIVRLSSEYDLLSCDTFDSDCSGMPGYDQEYWIRVAGSTGLPEKRKKRYGKEIRFGEYTFFTSTKNADKVTESRTGLLLDLNLARQIPVNPGLHARLAMIKDVMDLPIDEEGAENDK